MDSLVEAWFGLPGAGKTYSMVTKAFKARRRNPSLRVYSNFAIRLPGDPVLPLNSVDDLVGATDGVLLLDEAHILLDSRASMGGERKRVIMKLGQLRKARLRVWYATHDPSKVDKQLRMLTEKAHFMQSYKALGFFTGRIRAGVAPTAPGMGFFLVRFRQSVADCYDTFAEVGSEGWSAAGVGGVVSGWITDRYGQSRRNVLTLGAERTAEQWTYDYVTATGSRLRATPLPAQPAAEAPSLDTPSANSSGLAR